MKIGKRLLSTLIAGVVLAVSVFSAPLQAATPAATGPIRIGIIGTGKIGGALAEHWSRAGHELVISSRNPEELQELAKALGPKVKVGTAQEAAAFGDVVLISVPYAALPQVGKDYAKELKGKIVLDTCNPNPGRDGAMAEEARRKGTGVASPGFLPGVRLVRAFNTIPAALLKNGSNHAPEKYAVPLAADDAQALGMAQRLVREAGFDPVVVGGLSRAIEFDTGTPGYGKALTATELRQALKL